MKPKRYSKEDIKLKYIDILDEKGKKYFSQAMKIFLSIFKEDRYYVKVIKKIIQRKSHPKNTIFRLLVATDRRNDKVIGVCIYRHWTDINRATLEYLMVRLDLRGCGIGSILYKKLCKDLQAFGSKGFFFSCAGDHRLHRYALDNIWRKINVLRVKFYERLGARPLMGMNYNSPLYWDMHPRYYCYPNLCYHPLRKITPKTRVRVKSKIVKEVVKRIMYTYYGISYRNKHVKRILRSIKTKRLEWRPARYFKYKRRK